MLRFGYEAVRLLTAAKGPSKIVMMRIAIATDAWHPQVNSVVRTLGQTVIQLKDLGHDVRFITPLDFKTYPCPTYPSI